MGVIFAALRLSGKQPVSMDLFMQLVNIPNVNSLSFNIWIGIWMRTYLDENDFRHCYGNFFRKMFFEGYLITAMFIVPFQELCVTLKTAF